MLNQSERLSEAEAVTDAPRNATRPVLDLLDRQRDRTERLLNAVRAAVLLLLGSAALAYAPALPPALNRVNVLVLVPNLCWTALQYLLFHRRERLPGWLVIVNPLIDVSAVTAIILGYGLTESGALALKSPIFLLYFAILAARPMASSPRSTVSVALLVITEYAGLSAFFLASQRAILVQSPVAASAGAGVTLLDELAKVLFLTMAGAIATYATVWQERLARGYFRESRDRELLEVRLASAQLDALKLQLRPHFLFNTINTITALIPTVPSAATRMLADLSELLRASLRGGDIQEVTVSRELEVLEHYLDIQRTRFGDRLVIDVEVEARTRAALLPSLILQPLVENAIRHGIAPRDAGGRVEIHVRRSGDSLCLEVTDDGIGVAAVSDGEGVGLGNTRARLYRLYGVRHHFNAFPREGGGFAVRIDLPFRLAAEPAAAAVA
ncbi:MAG: histidine kinase [Anaerolineae bacterium]|nr:histidine kinase [Gemmatimonadaceae bacterium]